MSTSKILHLVVIMHRQVVLFLDAPTMYLMKKIFTYYPQATFALLSELPQETFPIVMNGSEDMVFSELL